MQRYGWPRDANVAPGKVDRGGVRKFGAGQRELIIAPMCYIMH